MPKKLSMGVLSISLQTAWILNSSLNKKKKIVPKTMQSIFMYINVYEIYEIYLRIQTKRKTRGAKNTCDNVKKPTKTNKTKRKINLSSHFVFWVYMLLAVHYSYVTLTHIQVQTLEDIETNNTINTYTHI